MALTQAERSYRYDSKHRTERVLKALARKRRRRDEVNAYKLARGCADCGYAEYPEALDFDHTADDKEYNVAYLLDSGGDENLWAEIAKCEVVCSNCHRHRTMTRIREKQTMEKPHNGQLRLVDDAYSAELW